jgi:pimeloyl-ACP methyl ester carboxylesterase
MTLSTSGNRCIAPFLRGYGQTRFLSQETPRSGEQAALGADLLALMDSLSIEKAILGGYDWAGRAACIVAALWPGRGLGLASAGATYSSQDIVGAVNPGSPDREARDRSGPQGLDPRTSRSDMAFRSSNANTCSHR